MVYVIIIDRLKYRNNKVIMYNQSLVEVTKAQTL